MRKCRTIRINAAGLHSAAEEAIGYEDWRKKRKPCGWDEEIGNETQGKRKNISVT